MAVETRPRAIIYTADPADLEAVDRCLGYIQRAGFRLVGIVQEWPAVAGMLSTGTAEYVVVDRRTDIPVDSRVHCVADAPTPRRSSRAGRTSRLNRRRGAGA